MLIAFKLKLALACAAGLAGPLAMAPLVMEKGVPGSTLRDPIAMVELDQAAVSYRVAGDFTKMGRIAEAPLVTARLERPLAIMKHQVSSADYQQCVDDRACRPLDRGVVVAADRPAVQVSWHDANAYAAWLSRQTGELPAAHRRGMGAGGRQQVQGRRLARRR